MRRSASASPSRCSGVGASRAASIALGAVISGIWNNFVKLGLPIIALGLLAATGEAGAALAVAAAVGLLVLIVCVLFFGLLLRSERLAAKVGTLAQRSLGRHAAARVPATPRGLVVASDAVP